jgi:hypothetical protein
MTVTRQSLAEQHRLFGDRELIELVQSPEMTTLAREVAGAELVSRGIELHPTDDESAADGAGLAPASAQDSAQDSADDPAQGETEPGDADLVEIARFLKPIEAEILRGRLEAEGVLAIVADANLARVNVILAPVIGGARVLVRAADFAQAREIMGAVERGDYRISDAEDDEPR